MFLHCDLLAEGLAQKKVFYKMIFMRGFHEVVYEGNLIGWEG